MMRKLIFLFASLILLWDHQAYSQINFAQVRQQFLTADLLKPGYVQEVEVMVTGIKKVPDAYYLTGNQKLSTRTYLDGLGRALQQQQDMGTAGKPNVVTFYVYDKYGRKKKQYLPYAANTGNKYQKNAVTDQAAFYSTGNSSGKFQKDNSPYSESSYDQSPLNEVLVQGAPGSAWQLSTNKVQKKIRRTNISSDNVRLFNGDGTSSGFYAAGSLNVEEVSDEQGRKVLTFSDKEGKLLLKREFLDETIQGAYKDYKNTYSIYNQAGLIIKILPPKVVDRMMNNSWALSSNDLNHNIYCFEYDESGRGTGKKRPSSGWVYMVYDKLDRLCLVQSAVQRATNKWNFLKYDRLNRIVLQGVLQDNTHTSRSSMQAYCDTYDYLNPAVTYAECRGSSIQNYTDLTFPQSTAFNSFDPLVINYYDSYDLDNNGTANYTYSAQGLSGDEPVAGSAQGQLTVTKAKKIGTGNWMSKIYFYDVNGQIIQEQSNNTTNDGVNDVKTNVIAFSGLLKRVLNKKKIDNTTHTIDESMTYDQACRLSSVSNKYNSNNAVTIAEYVYNELGQMVNKNLGKLAPSSYLQSVSLRYNIRGWLTGINNSNLNNDGYNEDSNDVFGMDIFYDASGGIGNTAMYNGQISGVKWRTNMNSHPFDDVGCAYTYGYDKLGQLKNALFFGNNGSGWNYRNGAFDEKNISYDLNGNLLGLERNMWSGSAVTSMDVLSYSYKSSGGNDQLMQVIDGNGGGGTYGFKNQSGDAEHYLYDANGNLIQDKNRNVTYTYNELGKINRLTLLSYTNRYIQYNYDGAGICLSKQVVDNGSTIKTTSYVEGFVAENNVLSYVEHVEGRLRTASGVGTYEYYIKDYLGNVRLSFENVGGVATVRQENSFYAFGLAHNATIVPSGANKKIIKDGEWENDFGNDPDLYTMFFRQYDPVLGRFNAVDPVAEKYTELTVYNSCFNNPISFTDPSGADPIGSWEDFERLVKTFNLTGGGYWEILNVFGPGDGMLGLTAGDPFWAVNMLMKDLRSNGWWDGEHGRGNFDAAIADFAMRNFGAKTVPRMNLDSDTFANQGKGLNGLTVLKYGVYNKANGVGGLEIQLGFKYTGNGLTNFNFIQTIRTNVPLGGASSPYNDPQPADDNLPFYWTNTELPSQINQNGFDVLFSDRPSRLMVNGTKWQAELSVVGMNRTGHYVPITTITYGFQIINNKVVIFPIKTSTPTSFQKKSIP